MRGFQCQRERDRARLLQTQLIDNASSCLVDAVVVIAVVVVGGGVANILLTQGQAMHTAGDISYID